jgi:hypothetical protein
MSASVAAIVVITSSTALAGRESTPRCPMNGSEPLVTSGIEPSFARTATTAVMYGWILQMITYTPGTSNSAEMFPFCDESWSSWRFAPSGWTRTVTV